MAAGRTLRREAFLGHVKERGGYGTAEEAEHAARVVLALLGAHLVGEVRAQLAARLPEGFALILFQLPVGYDLLFGRPQPT
ncbi:DUF2267 domain-containing protein [Streptomyces sp. 184]|uniref:DUF2267 domain-containing protein n=1 Tax=Streptomyces sp. 184 TaxID=1827526 RepID=UPI003892AA20